jgi:hypothetical protein
MTQSPHPHSSPALVAASYVIVPPSRLVACGRPGLRAGKIALNAQAEPRTQIGAEDAANESCDKPQPAVHGSRGDATEIGAGGCQ